MKKFLLSGSLLLIITTQINAQLTVTAELDDETFIYSLAGPGIVVSGIERNCAEGASGFFNSMDANVGIENGMLLTVLMAQMMKVLILCIMEQMAMMILRQLQGI